MRYNHNGKIIDSTSLEVPVNNRALQYGDGIFETMKFANGRINFWEQHYFRLMASMRIVRMEIPLRFSPEFLEQEMQKTLEANDLDTARIKFLVYRKEGGYYTPDTNDVDYLIFTTSLESPAFQLNEKGLEIDLYRDFYKQKGLLSNLKSSSAMIYTLASIFKKENKLDDVLLLNDDKMVAEASSSNVFMVKDTNVITPPLSDGCIKGVMRNKVLELLPLLGYEVHEQSFSPFDLQKADELFLTNATHGIRWVKAYRKKSFQNNCSLELVKKLNVAVALG